MTTLSGLEGLRGPFKRIKQMDLQEVPFLLAIPKEEQLLKSKRTKLLLEKMGNPQNKLKVIHVAGTNGKGSICTYLAELLINAGYKVGLVTNPGIVNIANEIRINDKAIHIDHLAQLFMKMRNLSLDYGQPVSPFDLLVLTSFYYFYKEKVDIAVIETGYGGLNDSTNVLDKPLLSIITRIALDHTKDLGYTTSDIARNKAGIIKRECPVLTLEDNEGLEEIEKEAQKLKSEIFLARPKDVEIYQGELTLKKKTLLKTPYLALFQQDSIALLVKAMEILNKEEFVIKEDHLIMAIESTKIPYRFEYLQKKQIILDAAHNPHAAHALKENLDHYFPDYKRIFIFSSMDDKDYKGILKALINPDDKVITTEIKKRMKFTSQNEVHQYIRSENLTEGLFSSKTIKEALEKIKELTDDKTITIITGSLYLIENYLIYTSNERNEIVFPNDHFLNTLIHKWKNFTSFRTSII